MSRASDVQKRREFSMKLDKMWDIGAPNAVQTINQDRMLSGKEREEDIAF